jgi:hypothetical protein
MFITLIEHNDIKIVVSTAGAILDYDYSSSNSLLNTIRQIGINPYFETMAFHAYDNDEYNITIPLNSADVTRQVPLKSKCLKSKCFISHIDKQDYMEANNMHEAVIEEIKNRLLQGESLDEKTCDD